MLDYLETGLFHGGPGAEPSPHRRPRPPDGHASGVRRVLTDGRVLAVAAVVAVVLAILVGISAPLRSTQAGPGRPPVTPGAVNPGVTSRSPGTSATPSPARPSTAPPPARSSASAGAAGSNGAVPRQATPAATAGTAAGASPAASAPATRRAARTAAGAAVVVTFTVTSQGGGLFEGKIRIVDNGTSPLANWQVSVALPGDRVVAVANASGFVIRGILLLQPASGAAPVPARGGVLTVFFVAAGSQPVAGACSYNQTPCA
jgi:hypothetical protein